MAEVHTLVSLFLFTPPLSTFYFLRDDEIKLGNNWERKKVVVAMDFGILR